MCKINQLKIRKRCKTPEEPCVLYIIWKGETLGICERCWQKIAEKDWEIGDSPKLTMEEALSDLARFGPNPTLTEYKYRGKQIVLDGEEEMENSWRKRKTTGKRNPWQDAEPEDTKLTQPIAIPPETKAKAIKGLNTGSNIGKTTVKEGE